MSASGARVVEAVLAATIRCSADSSSSSAPLLSPLAVSSMPRISAVDRCAGSIPNHDLTPDMTSCHVRSRPLSMVGTRGLGTRPLVAPVRSR
eukprot:5936443-Prymnesium_polylepis.1